MSTRQTRCAGYGGVHAQHSAAACSQSATAGCCSQGRDTGFSLISFATLFLNYWFEVNNDLKNEEVYLVIAVDYIWKCVLVCNCANSLIFNKTKLTSYLLVSARLFVRLFLTVFLITTNLMLHQSNVVYF